ncbi:MAG TPA: diphthine--ammonia ligase [Thermoplasmata archaeon]|nr:diphthine--ammonia ligase [Thermoplasmata archaeon]
MTVTALVSGGKDSVYAAYLAECQGWPVDELVTVRPDDPDSMLFHTPNLDLVALQARAWGRRHRTVRARGSGEAAELAALEEAIAGTGGPVVTGAIASSFQWSRIVRLADRAGRWVYAPLWRRPAARVVQEEIAAGLEIVLVHLAADPLPAAWVGRRLDGPCLEELGRVSDGGRRMNVAGEGGEYETVVVDAPFFASRLEIDARQTVVSGTTARLDISSAHLKRKERPSPTGPAG